MVKYTLAIATGILTSRAGFHLLMLLDPSAIASYPARTRVNAGSRDQQNKYGTLATNITPLQLDIITESTGLNALPNLYM